MLASLLRRLVQVRPREVGVVLWAFAYHFFVFAGYNVLRPLRETMGIAGGVSQLPWLYTGTFLGMLVAVPFYSALVSRLRRRVFIPIVYHFFALNLLVFAGLFVYLGDEADVVTGRVYFIWLSIFNLFAVSVFWSFMADVFTDRQAKRLFGFLAGGASLGSLFGSMLMAQVLGVVSADNLEIVILVPIALLELAVLCVHRIGRRLDAVAAEVEDAEVAERIAHDDDEVLAASGLWGGFVAVFRSRYLRGICAYLLLATFLGTQVYYYQAEVVTRVLDDKVDRTAFFNTINLWANAITLVLQIFVSSRLMRSLGVALTLLVLPLTYLIGFAFLGSFTALWAIMAFQITSRSVKYGVAKPTKEVLFTVVPRDEKYKSKSFIDTVVYRGGDVIGGWAFRGATDVLRMSLSTLAYATIPLCALWGLVAWLLGRGQMRRAARLSRPAPADAEPGRA